MKLALLGMLLLAQAAEGRRLPDHIIRMECHSLWNHRRSEFAKNYGISNMNEVEYSTSLEKILYEELEKLNGSSTPTIFTKDSMLFLMNPLRNFTALHMRFLSEAGSTQFACTHTGNEGTGYGSLAIDLSGSPIYLGKPGSQCPPGRQSNWRNLCTLKKDKYERKRGLWGQVGATIEGWFD